MDVQETDLLVCGSCQKYFPLQDIGQFIQHKKFDCDSESHAKKALVCQLCVQVFTSPWTLLKHAQVVHALKIFIEETYGGAVTNVSGETNNVGDGVVSVSRQNGVNKGTMQQQLDQLGETEMADALPYSSTPSNSQVSPISSMSRDNSMTTVTYSKCNTGVGMATGPKEALENTNSSMSDAAVQVGDEKSEEQEKQICCDDENCGVVVMPGTHEELKKCCARVVPKKRKRHMETKHMPRKGSKKKAKQGSTHVYIDFEQADIGSFSVNQESSQHEIIQGNSRDSVDQDPQANQTTESSHNFSTVIIPAGSGRTFSIPLSYDISTTRTMSPLMSMAPSPSMKPFPQSIAPKTEDFSSEQQTQFEMKGSSGQETISHSTEDTSMDGQEQEELLQGNDKTISLKKRRYPTSRPYKCDQCDHSFNQRIHLKKHQSKHTGVKPYKCGQCDYATVERSHLKVHIRVHTGEKPFKCTYCEYATAQNSTLKIHLKRHHKSSAGFSCNVCGKQFQEKELLSDHSKEHSIEDTSIS